MKYNKKGQEADSEQKIFAEELDGSKQKVYSVLTYNNLVYDPLGADSHRESRINLELKKTNKTAFSQYVKYLQTNNRIYITQAQRSHANG